MLTIKYIVAETEKHYKLIEGQIHTKTRKREIVIARQVAMYFSKLYTKETLYNIGDKIGNKDHATVLHAIKTVNNLIDTDKKFKIETIELLNDFFTLANENVNCLITYQDYLDSKNDMMLLLVKRLIHKKLNGESLFSIAS